MLVIAIAASALLACSVRAQSEPEDASPAPVIGYVDADRDGVNDRFRDQDGDGVNDLNDQPIPTTSPF